MLDPMYVRLMMHIRKEIPDFRVSYKDTTRDWLIRACAVVVSLFNRGFRDRVTTTLYPVVYFPSKEVVQSNPKHAFLVLAHEYVHLHDAKSGNVRFSFLYLCPQIFGLLAALSLLSFWDLSWLWCLSFLAFAAPLPAYWRARSELRGYAMSLCVVYWLRGEVPQEYQDSIRDKFTGWHYYMMWPFRRWVVKWISSVIRDLEGGSFPSGLGDDHPYRQVKKIVQKSV